MCARAAAVEDLLGEQGGNEEEGDRDPNAMRISHVEGDGLQSQSDSAAALSHCDGQLTSPNSIATISLSNEDQSTACWQEKTTRWKTEGRGTGGKT